MTHGTRWAALGRRCRCACCRDAAVTIKRADNRRSRLTGHLTATLRHLPSGELVTLNVTAETVPVAVAELVDGLRADEWQVASLSTVRTILLDVKGRKPVQAAHSFTSPEVNLLGRVGRLDLLGGRA